MMTEPGLFSDDVERAAFAVLDALPTPKPSEREATTATIAVRKLHENGAASGDEWIGPIGELADLVGVLMDGETAVIVVKACGGAPVDPATEPEPF